MLPVLSYAVAAANTTPAPGSLDRILVACSKASGALDDRSAWECSGNCYCHGANQKFTFDFKGSRFFDAATGPLDDIAAYDGRRCWIEDWAGTPHYTGLVER